MEVDDSRSVFEKSQLLNDEGNRLFRTQEHRQGITKYDKALQYLGVIVPETEEHAQLMEELGIALNLNLAAGLLKLSAYEEARNHCDLESLSKFAFRYDEELLLALKFDPSNDEVKQESLKVKQMCKPSCANSPIGQKENGIGFPIELDSSSVGAKLIDPWNLGNSSHLVCSPQMKLNNGKVVETNQGFESYFGTSERKRELDVLENRTTSLSERSCLDSN
ncbi:hypothetical protein Cgig2_008529 [Carnegiea gigantea]|uniref:Uncharacterized protein n=1 Tax=Carnegiea gigantea TaxID=171969 RepID=A0A9Q1JSJ0_9CARY|nr:hypothetical protein Cgig2_008529 [Carnegiea gigantea]